MYHDAHTYTLGTATPKKSSFIRVVSTNLGEYPYEYVERDVDKNVDSMLTSFRHSEVQFMRISKPSKAFIRMQNKLLEYSKESKSGTLFPFSQQKAYGLSIESMQEAFAKLNK